MFVSKKCLGITIIVLDNILKICIELIRSRNDNVMEKFYRLWTFENLIFLIEISKISKIFEKMKIPLRGAPALRVIRAGTRLTVHRSLPYCAGRKVFALRVDDS